jgi:hypothetical protein
MKRCPSCNRTYDDSQAFCSTDATPLVSEAAASDPEATIAAPPASDLPPTQVATTAQTPGYQQPYQQQWTPPQQQQWGAPPASRNTNKIILLAVIGLVIAVGVGLGVYFLTRSSSTSDSSSSGGSSSASSSADFVGTWKLEGEGDRMKINADGTITELDSTGKTRRTVTYTKAGDTLTAQFGGNTVKFTLESKNRLRAVESEHSGREKPPFYFTRE